MSSNSPSIDTILPAGKPLLLFVDDDPIIVDALSVVLAKDYDIITAESRRQSISLLQDLSVKPSLALIDLGLPPTPHSPEEGFKLVKELIALNNSIKILILSGQDKDVNIHYALTLGAVDFIPKPCNMTLLKARLKHQVMMLQAEGTRREQSGESALLGESPVINTLKDLIKQFADTVFPVFVSGESGTGKELVAEELHNVSIRAKSPYLTINCAAFTPDLLEAQLFGHAKGAFTGAISVRSGFFEEAKDGTLFLDEIGELPLVLQAKLLRVLENGEFYRIGETQPRISKARIVAATNRNLRQEVRIGTFRQDLYHRLCVLAINVPPLRDREKDVFLLFEHFRKMYMNGNALFTMDDEAIDLLGQYDFPGNIRELRNVVIRLSAKYAGKRVSKKELNGELEMDYELNEFDSDISDEMLLEELKSKDFDLDKKLTEWEKRYVNQALSICNGSLSRAARMLGISRTTLYNRFQRLEITNRVE